MTDKRVAPKVDEHKRQDFYRSVVPLYGYSHSECSCGWRWSSSSKNALTRAAKLKKAWREHLEATQ